MNVVEKFMTFSFGIEVIDKDLSKGLEAFQSPASFIVKQAYLTESKAGNVVTNLVDENETVFKVAQHNMIQALHKTGLVKKGEAFTLVATDLVGMKFTRTEKTMTISRPANTLTAAQQAKYDQLIAASVPADQALALATA